MRNLNIFTDRSLTKNYYKLLQIIKYILRDHFYTF